MTASLHESDFFSWSVEQAALLKSGRLPATCPWTLDQVRDEDYWPDRKAP